METLVEDEIGVQLVQDKKRRLEQRLYTAVESLFLPTYEEHYQSWWVVR